MAPNDIRGGVSAVRATGVELIFSTKIIIFSKQFIILNSKFINFNANRLGHGGAERRGGPAAVFEEVQ